MTETPHHTARGAFRFGWFEGLVGIVLVLTVARLIVLFLTPYNLGPDEAQYWFWSTEPAFGYFSKSPMIAWLIGATTFVCGDAEACIRLSSPLIHAGTALLLFALARMLYDARTGFWAGALYLTMPAVWLSANIASTDVPLLFFWSAALIGLWRTLETRDLKWAAFTGAMVGLGLLSKYAMVYFALSFIVYLAVAREARWLAWSRAGAVGLLAALVVFAPNIWWNIDNSFATLGHTAANANWGADLFNIGNLLDFVGAQFGVFGPLMMAGLIWGIVTLRTRLGEAGEAKGRDIFLLCFVLPILVVACGQAFISRANANWAAPAYAAATVLVAAWVMRTRFWRLIAPASLGLHTVVGALFMAFVLSPALVEALGRSNDFKRVSGWDEIARLVQQEAMAAPYAAISFDDRLLLSEMLYYARPYPAPMRAWPPEGAPQHHFEMTRPLSEAETALVLHVTFSPERSHLDAAFASVAPVRTATITLIGDKTQTVRFYALSGFRGFPRAEE
jgi:4-amino-4-deoxy-L-arabinose transferase-like glycosyltransferase